MFASPEALREMIFYSAESAYTHQYRDIAPQKYRDDSEWLLSNEHIKLNVGYDVCRNILNIIDRKMRKTIEHSVDIPLEKFTLLPGFVLNSQELAQETNHPIEDIRGICRRIYIASRPIETQASVRCKILMQHMLTHLIRKSADEVILLQY